MLMMQMTGVKMSIAIKGGIIGDFTFTEDKSTEFYNKESIGFRGALTLDLECNGYSRKMMQRIIDDAKTQKYKIESDIGIKVGDTVSVQCEDIEIKIKITEFDCNGAAIGVLINEQANKKN